jgi:membrane fusion protein (multidrug efflux system)
MTNEGRRPWRRWALICAGVVTLAAAAFGGFSLANGASGKAKPGDDKADQKEREPPTVAVAQAETGPISAYITATANLVAEQEVQILAEAEGKVIELLVEEGTAVRKGERLLRIEREASELAVEKADLGLRNASANLERAESLWQQKLLSTQERDKARFDRDLARSNLTEARYRLGKTDVVAPFAGRVTLRKAQLGQTLKLGDELLVLADFDPLVARIFLPEREVLDLRVGQEAQLALKAREDVRFLGRIRQISPIVDTASGTVKVTVEALEPPPSVRPGTFVSVGIVQETRPRAVLVPRTAVVRELQEAYVYVVEGTQARKRAVDVGLEEAGRLEITKGLEGGEQVVTSGQGALKDQAAVKIASAPGGRSS